jgi:hypothetical protein
MRLFIWRRADCLVCGKRVWSPSRNSGLWANAATILLRLLGRPETVWDIRSVQYGSSRCWFVHAACAREQRAMLDEMHRQIPQRPAIEYELRQAGGVKIVAGMPEREVVSLLGEPIAKVSIDVYLHFRAPVPSFGGRSSNIDFWLFDVLRTPGRVLRVAFGETGRVLGIDEVDEKTQPMPVREQRGQPLDGGSTQC